MIQENIFKEFRRIVSENANLITFQNNLFLIEEDKDNMVVIGSFFGYRSVLLYFHLNNKLEIHTSDIVYLLKHLKSFLYLVRLRIRKYIVLFFNDNNNKLIFFGRNGK